jgi:hypothetical protein
VSGSVGVNRWKDEDSMGGREEGIYSMLEIAITRIGEFTFVQKICRGFMTH